MNPYTTIAIQKFDTQLKKVYQLEKANLELRNAVTKIPRDELTQYYETTEQIRTKYREKYLNKDLEVD